MSDIAAWLKKLGLGKYAEVFVENAIDFDIVTQLGEQDLKELGLPLGDRKRLLNGIAALDTEIKPILAKRSDRPAEVAQKPQAERRQLTVMFVDLVGSTALSSLLDPEDMRGLILAYQNAVAGEITRFEGYLAKYMGDGVLAYFGWPRAHEDEAERAVRAALAVTGVVKKLRTPADEPLAARVGIATGLVVVGDLIGEGAAQEEAVVGETPNLAARLQALAEPGNIVISDSTRHLCGGMFELEPMGAQQLKGVAAAVDIFKVGGERTTDSRYLARRTGELLPLIGREQELTRIMECWQQAAIGEGRMVFLTGEAGIGKSRILHAVNDAVKEQPHYRISYQCSPYHTDSALYPAVQQLTRAAAFEAGDDDETKLDKLEALLGLALADPAKSAPLIAALLGIGTDTRYGKLDLTPQQQRAQTLQVLVAQLIGLAQRQPVLFVLEDAHWIDPSTLELIELALDVVGSSPVLLLITARPTFEHYLGGHPVVTRIMLNRLGRESSAVIIKRISGGKSLPEALLDEIIRKADGVPLFVEELTKTVLRSGQLRETDTAYVLDVPLRSIDIPSSLHDSLMARLDRLQPIREIAQTAACIGREFSYQLLSAVSELDMRTLQQALAQLTEAELIFRCGTPLDAAYIFKHALVRDAAYESLLRTKRRELHAEIAHKLENAFPEKAELEPELLAHHYTEAGLTEPAVHYWLKAGKQAVKQCAHTEAIAHLERGLVTIEKLPDGKSKTHNEIAFRVALGVPLIGKEGAASPKVVENYRQAQRLCIQTGEREQMYPILWGLWFHYFLNSKLHQACQLADELLALGQSRHDVELSLEAHHCQWASRFVVGDLTGAMEHCDRGMQLYRAESHHSLAFIYGGHDPGVCARNVSGIGLWLLGFPEQAKERLDSSLALARELGHSATLADTLQMVVELSALNRDEEMLGRQARELLELSTAEKMFDNETLANGLLGWLEFQRGDRKSGLQLMRAAAKLWLEQGTAWTAVPISLVAEALGQIGEAKEGLKLIDEAISLGKRDQIRWCEAELHRVKGDLLLNDDPEAVSIAEDCFKRAVEISKLQNAKLPELRACLNLARLWQIRGRIDQAWEVLDPVYGWFTEGFDTADLKDAKALLNELA